MADRKLASIVEIDDVVEHSNADSLELGIVGGWQCCIKKGEFKKGDLALYCEIDSLLPLNDSNFSFLEERKEGLKVVEGKNYSRIRTIKLRKELSQGLLIPVPESIKNPKAGDDVTSKLGVLKYEKPEVGVNLSTIGVTRTSLFGKLIRKIATKGVSNMMPWPGFIPKTDQERVQNCTRAYTEAQEKGELFEVSFKLDGSSWTGFSKSGKTGVCSRNYQLRTEDVVWTKTEQYRNYVADFLMYNMKFFKNWKIRFPELKTGIKGIKVSEDNFVKMFRHYKVAEVLDQLYKELGVEVALQGEMIGPGIQQNFEGNKELDLYIYNVYVINGGRNNWETGYMQPTLAKEFVESIGMKYVPLLSESSVVPETAKACLEMAEGKSAFPTGKYREGIVFKSLDRDFSFKAISNSYLLKNDG